MNQAQLDKLRFRIVQDEAGNYLVQTGGYYSKLEEDWEVFRTCRDEPPCIAASLEQVMELLYINLGFRPYKLAENKYVIQAYCGSSKDGCDWCETLPGYHRNKKTADDRVIKEFWKEMTNISIVDELMSEQMTCGSWYHD